MDNSEKKPKFEIQPIIEQKPFENPAVQSFFTKWCEVNDSIEPQFVDREEWEQKRVGSMLQKRSDGKQTLFIPKDLQLWEMVGVMETIDHDTFAGRPERHDAAKKKLLELGKTFQDTGIYISQRLDSIEKGQEIARPLAVELYDYGQWLIDGTNSEKFEGMDDDIPSHTLTAPEIETVDRFLAGDNLYESRRSRAEKKVETEPDKKDELYEEERRATLAQFFRASAKAFELTQKSESGELRENKDRLQPWRRNTPLHNAFLTRVERALSQKIETPKRELGAAMFRRGMDLLQKNMPFDTLPDWVKNSILHWQNGEKTLSDALQIDHLKAELETVRKTGDTFKISITERIIADKIQGAVSNFQYKTDAHNPSEMVANQYLNCVGASTLGGALFKEAGLTYLVGDVPLHSILFLITEDGHIQWRDMLNSWSNENMTDNMIDGRKKNGAPLTTSDIVAFSKNPTPEGLMFDIKNDKYRQKFNWVKEKERQYVTLFEPEYGQQIQILNNTGIFLENLGRIEEALEAYRQAAALKPKMSYPYFNMGGMLSELGRDNEAIEAYRQAIAINPQFAPPYNRLGNTLFKLGRDNEAIETYRQAIAVDFGYAYAYYNIAAVLSKLERNEEAIEEYQKFIDRADIKNDDRWIKQAQEMIAKLKISIILRQRPQDMGK